MSWSLKILHAFCTSVLKPRKKWMHQSEVHRLMFSRKLKDFLLLFEVQEFRHDYFKRVSLSDNMSPFLSALLIIEEDGKFSRPGISGNKKNSHVTSETLQSVWSPDFVLQILHFILKVGKVLLQANSYRTSVPQIVPCSANLSFNLTHLFRQCWHRGFNAGQFKLFNALVNFFVDIFAGLISFQRVFNEILPSGSAMFVSFRGIPAQLYFMTFLTQVIYGYKQ